MNLVRNNTVFIIILLLFNLYPIKVYAEEELSFQQAVHIALENNNNIKAMRSALSASERDIGIAKSNVMPKFKVAEEFVSTNNPAQVFAYKLNQGRLTQKDFDNAPGSFNNPGNITNFLTGVYFEQPILAKKAHIGIDMAKKEYSAHGYDFLRQQEDLVNKVIQTYLLVDTTAAFLGSTQKAVEDSQEHLRIAKVRYKAELGLYSDVLRAQTALIEAEQKQISAQKNYEVAKRALGLLLGRDESVNISQLLPMIPVKEISYYNQLSLGRNDIKAMEVRAENAKNGIKFAAADFFPTFGVTGGYQLYDNQAPFGAQGNNYFAGGALNWSAFDGNRRKYEKLKAKDRQVEVQEYLEGLKKHVSYRVFESYLTVNETRKNLEMADSALKSAEEGKRLVFKRWEASLSPFVDLMDAQTNLDKSRANFVKCQNDYVSAIINLSFESGILTQELALE